MKIKNLPFTLLDFSPLHFLLKKLIVSFSLGTYEQRINVGLEKNRSHYAYIVFSAARLAKKLGLDRISVIEFGVAGGNGLLALEHHAKIVEEIFNIQIDIWGFDLSTGLPSSSNYRDIPFYWKSGFFKMDVDALRQKLTKSKLVIGNVNETISKFTTDHDVAPIGAISFDLDYYTSTRDAMKIFLLEEKYLLPRIFCYYDDIVGDDEALISEWTGQRLAINEFNSICEENKIDKIYSISDRKILNRKYNRIRVAHFFKHKKYNEFIGPENQQLPMTS